MSKTTIPSGGITDGTLTSAKLDQDGAFTFNEDSADVNFRVESNGNANMLFVDGGNDFVGIGAVPTQAKLHIITNDSGALNDANSDDFMIENTDATGMSIGSATNGEGHIYFSDSDDADVGGISYFHGSNYMVFRVNASERMRITSDGDLNFAQGQLQLLADNSAATSTAKWDRGAGQGGNTSTALQFCHGGSVKGSIGYDDGSTSYNTSSDYRLKENAVAISDGIIRLKTLKPYRFNFKTNTDKTIDGFFAHEVTAVPEAITGTKDAMAVETRYTADDVETQGDTPSKKVGDPKTYSTTEIDAQAIDQSKLVPLLTAALKEAITEIESLKARVTTLEG